MPKHDIASHEQCPTADRQVENPAGEEQARQTEVNKVCMTHSIKISEEVVCCVFILCSCGAQTDSCSCPCCQLKLMSKAYVVVFKKLSYGASY